MSVSYIAFSYHYASDYEFMRQVATALAAQGVPTWYLDKLDKPLNVTREQRIASVLDWREVPQNWHATFLDHIILAGGILIVLSEPAAESRNSMGRGMWRERASIDYLSADNPLRVREIIRNAGMPSEELIEDLALWGRQVLALPPVLRSTVDHPNALNRSTGLKGPGQWPELKTRASVWYELVRLDLYDVQWHCRRCGLQSFPYTFSEEFPPLLCPRCGFGNIPDNSPSMDDPPALAEREKGFLDKVTSEYVKQREQLNKDEQMHGKR